MRILAVVLSVFLPGLGHLVMGRVVRGAAFLLGTGLCLDGLLFVHFRMGDESGPHVTASMAGLAGVAGIVWLFALVDVVRLLRPDAEEVRKRREAHYRRGMIHYLRDELPQAVTEFSNALKLDAYDTDTLFHLALAHKESGDPRQARRFLRLCLELDEQKKWAREARQELGSMKG